ncbi:hypothetical protein R83H12_00837 [Fibrobacteria bacterium R8-3-H12]
MSLEPIRAACVFFEGPALTPAQKNAAENEMKQRQAAAEARAALSSAKQAAKQEQYPCRDSKNRVLYCNWNSGCYAIDPRYADPPGGTCDSHIENCKKWGALFVGVTKEGAGINCSNVGGSVIKGFKNVRTDAPANAQPSLGGFGGKFLYCYLCPHYGIC